MPLELLEELKDWLANPIARRQFNPEELAALKKLSLSDLMKQLEERLKEQKERHDGGNRWIGTGGTSPFGHGGTNPQGIRIGGAPSNYSGSRSAIKIAAERRFRNYRSDLILDTRQIKMALKKLRFLRREGPQVDVDMDETIDKTCKNAGDIDIVFKAERRNDMRILLLMDVGGTMDPYAELVSQLFSAAHSSTHFKDFQYFYFHNCVYSHVYKDASLYKRVPTADLFRKFSEKYRLIVVGDASMNPGELLWANGVIDFFAAEEPHSGLYWLEKVRDHYPRHVWLNPEPKPYWYAETTQIIQRVFPMFPLSLEGLDEGVRTLV